MSDDLLDQLTQYPRKRSTLYADVLIDRAQAELTRLRASNAELESDFELLGRHAGSLRDKLEKIEKVNAELLAACQIAVAAMKGSLGCKERPICCCDFCVGTRNCEAAITHAQETT